MTDLRFRELLNTYLYVFDVFATDKSEVAKAFSISPSSALNRLKKLEEHGLISRYALQDLGGGLTIDVSGQPKGKGSKYKELTWQANETYDDTPKSVAVVNFLKQIQAPSQAALDYAASLFNARGGYTDIMVNSPLEGGPDES